VVHRDISLRCGVWSLSGHSGLWQAERPVDLWVHGLENSTLTRSSIAAISSQVKPSNALELQASNSGALYDFIVSKVGQILSSPERQPYITPKLIKEAHVVALAGIAPNAGHYRPTALIVFGSNHVSPSPDHVPELIEEFCNYVNSAWDKASALHLAAYALWRLLWIHPFSDGNGRVARALSYLVLSAKLGAVLPGTPTLPALIAQNRDRYYKVLEAADKAQLSGAMDVGPVEELLSDLLALQLNNVAVLPDDAEGRLEKTIENRVLRATPELRQSMYGTMELKYQLWSHGACLTLQICSYEELIRSRERQLSYGDPFPSLLSASRNEASNILSDERSVHFLHSVELHDGGGGALYLPPDAGLILSSVQISDRQSQYSIGGALYCIRLGAHTTIENCDELFDLLIARHIRVMS
jgi:fido (protein-threonine AMPylation protein)